MSGRRRLILICSIAACLGVFLAFIDRRGRENATAATKSAPGTGNTIEVVRGKPAPDPMPEDPRPIAPILEQPKRDEPVAPKVEPQPEPPPEDRTPARKAAYLKIIAALDGVEAAAIKKYGHKPGPDDKAEITIPYKAFVNSQTQRVRKQLAKDLGFSEVAIDQIKVEGDRAGWPKR